MNYIHPQFFSGFNSQFPSQYWYHPAPSTCPMQNQWKYPTQPIQPPYQPFQNHPPMKNAQWTNTPQGYRPPNQQQQALFPPPPQPNNIHISVVPRPPKQPQFPTQPISN
jgi:hypothetical protein